jgi:arginyl-tRNA---protein transferase
MNVADEDITSIYPYGVQLHGKCGYCHQSSHPNGNCHYGMETTSLHIDIYDTLMLRGWTRSGTYLYHPLNHKTCCPQYAIRIPVNQFQLTKSQKKFLRIFQNRLIKRYSSSTTSQPAKIDIITQPATFSEAKYELYCKYNLNIHQQNPFSESTQSQPSIPSKHSFTSFLVTSPLLSTFSEETPKYWSNYPEIINHLPLIPYGTYHQEYYLVQPTLTPSTFPTSHSTPLNPIVEERKLIAVGVIDIVPSGMDSVYFYYDPDYRDLGLGKYAAFQELLLCSQWQCYYYYLGYYVHDCKKMNYKREYHPMEILCPVTLHWSRVESRGERSTSTTRTTISNNRSVFDRLDAYRFVPLSSNIIIKLPSTITITTTTTTTTDNTANTSLTAVPLPSNYYEQYPHGYNSECYYPVLSELEDHQIPLEYIIISNMIACYHKHDHHHHQEHIVYHFDENILLSQLSLSDTHTGTDTTLSTHSAHSTSNAATTTSNNNNNNKMIISYKQLKECISYLGLELSLNPKIRFYI